MIARTPDESEIRAPLAWREPPLRELALAVGVCLVLVVATRLPVARTGPIESDEFGYLELIRTSWFPMHHTLFLTLGRIAGLWVGDTYRGFIWLDMATSVAALAATWWFLRGLADRWTAAAGTLVLAMGPVFWGYGAVASNYTAIVLVGSLLLGIGWRDWHQPSKAHPFVAAVVIALGGGYRSDVLILWGPLFAVILWRHRWNRALSAGLLVIVIISAWYGAMLADVGGLARYREKNAEFAYQAGYLNSVWNLGLINGPARYSVKMAMALVWTLGLGLVFVPRGVWRLASDKDGRRLLFLLGLSILPALFMHLLVHFGSQGYVLHEVPAVLALIVVGVAGGAAPADRKTAGRLAGLAFLSAAVFLFYPTDYQRPGWRGEFDLSFCRLTRQGLRAAMPQGGPKLWRTANSRPAAKAG